MLDAKEKRTTEATENTEKISVPLVTSGVKPSFGCGPSSTRFSL
jgi:hypothetical protein